jgi:hypothetical protein
MRQIFSLPSFIYYDICADLKKSLNKFRKKFFRWFADTFMLYSTIKLLSVIVPLKRTNIVTT